MGGNVRVRQKGTRSVGYMGMEEAANSAKRERKGPRRLNAWIAALVSVLFFAHACLGCMVLFAPGFPTNFEWVVWVGVCAVCVHVVMSGATTWAMFTDKIRPPSRRKKGHQIKKWITGGLLAVAVGIHLAAMAAGLESRAELGIVLGAVAILLCVHVCTGVKSLTRDLGADGTIRTPIRVGAIVLCVALCVALLFLAMRAL